LSLFQAIQLIAKLRLLELYGLYDTEITTTSTCSSRQPHQFSSKLRKKSYVFSQNRKSLRKGFQLVTMAVETGEKSESLKAEFFFSILMFIAEYIKRLKCLLRFILTPFKGSEVNACSLFESYKFASDKY